MKTTVKIFLFLLIPFLMSCASNVKTVKYTNADLSKFKTFACYTGSNSFNADQFKTNSKKPIDQSLITLINDNMTKKGFTENKSEPDLVIFLVNSNEINSNNGREDDSQGGIFNLDPYNFPMPSGLVPGYNRVTNTANNKVKDIPLTNGALVVEVFNRETKELVWLGVAKDFKSHISDQTLMSRMVNRVLKEFPN